VCNPRRLPFSQKRQVVVEETENEDSDASGGSHSFCWMEQNESHLTCRKWTRVFFFGGMKSNSKNHERFDSNGWNICLGYHSLLDSLIQDMLLSIQTDQECWYFLGLVSQVSSVPHQVLKVRHTKFWSSFLVHCCDPRVKAQLNVWNNIIAKYSKTHPQPLFNLWT